MEKIISDKAKTSKSTVKALLNEIELREELNCRLLEKIDMEVHEESETLRKLIERRDHYQFERIKESNKLELHVRDRILELEKEKRQESLECWRDLMFLKKYLLSALKNYWDLIKRRGLLSE